MSPRETFQPIFDRIYRHPPPGRQEQDEWLQSLALVFITLALGAFQNLELPPNDPLAEEFFSLSKSALAKGQFMVHNTIAAVQTLVRLSARGGVADSSISWRTSASRWRKGGMVTTRGRCGDSPCALSRR